MGIRYTIPSLYTMPEANHPNDKATIISMAILAIAVSSALHEGVGHGVVAWLRGDVPTELTSNHLSDLHPDRLVDAGGTLINLAAGSLAMLASQRVRFRPNARYFLWLLGCFNLLDGAGYFLFSGILGLGDWRGVIDGFPHPLAWRVGMSLFGAALYVLVVRTIAYSVKAFCPDKTKHRPIYNALGRLPYYGACTFYCFAGAFDPLGLQLLFLSTIPAAFGGLSGMMWADTFLPSKSPEAVRPLTITRKPVWWVAAFAVGLAYLLSLGRGIHFRQ